MQYKKVLLSASLLLATTFASAALPPFHQSSKEMVKLLQNPQLEQIFGAGRWIKGVERHAEGYLVKSNHGCSALVGIRYLPLPDGMVGPAKFEFDFPAEITCAR
jgi:hypothetical protein